MYIKPIVLLTKTYNEMDVITPQVEQIVKESEIQNGMVTVLTKHTTTGITVNEAWNAWKAILRCFCSGRRRGCTVQPCPHAAGLRIYGRQSRRSPEGVSHRNHCHFPLVEGEMIRGGAQDIYFCEFDGPAKRTILVIVQE